MRTLIFMAVLFCDIVTIKAQDEKVTDMGTSLMYRSRATVFIADGVTVPKHPSYIFYLPKTLEWYCEMPGKIMFILDKNQAVFVEVVINEVLKDTAYIPSKEIMEGIISRSFFWPEKKRKYKKMTYLIEKADFQKKGYLLMHKNNCRVLFFNFKKENLDKTINLLQCIQVKQE